VPKLPKDKRDCPNEFLIGLGGVVGINVYTLSVALCVATKVRFLSISAE
jgi:hypothetical protein